MGNQPLISVIVPIYNVEKYLNRCIESIVNQTYKNLEIILVDDGSPDNCPKMCDNWGKKDARIKVIHKKNGGLSDARNAGLEIALGYYISFIDSDDFIDLKFYEKLIKNMEEYKCDISVCNFCSFADKSEVVYKELPEKIITFDTVEALREVISYGKIKQVVWNKLFKRSLIDGIMFDVGKLHEDTFWSYKIFGRAKKTVLTDYVGYFYFQRSGSIMSKFNTKSLFDSTEARVLRIKYIDDNFPELLQFTKYEFFLHCLGEVQDTVRFLQDKDEQKKIIKYIKETEKSVNLSVRDIFAISPKYSVWYIVSKVSLCCTCKLRNRFNIGF